MQRLALFAAALFGLLGVVLGAIAAHALTEQLHAEQMRAFDTAVRYQQLHAVALLAVALLYARRPASPALAGCVAGFVTGTVLFSGSLYVLALGGPRWLGPLTPVGGSLLILGWLSLAWAALRHD